MTYAIIREDMALILWGSMMKARYPVALGTGRAFLATASRVFDSPAFAGLTGTADGAEPLRIDQEPKFRNRERELEEVVSALHNDDASHFWLWVAPPQLGKTWFLRKIGEGLLERRSGCLVHKVDVREFTAAADVHDPMALLARMYRVPASGLDPREIAAAISRTGRYNLCLLDSAELLSDDTIRGMRKGLEEIDRHVKDGRSRDARLALVAASRQDEAWRGVAPLRLSIRNLTEFKEDVVLESLCDLAADMRTDHTRFELRRLAGQVHRLSEGLPALLAGYLAWIRRAEWIGLDRLAKRDCFDEIASPYIGGDLLSPSSLYGRRSNLPADLRAALIEALLVLVPYRFFTGSHLSYHARQGKLRDALVGLGWSEEELRAAISRTDVLLLPQNEPWDAISPPIRRLLFRHWYGSPDNRARAHRVAREFLESYADNLTGRERAEVTIECLWHEAEALSLSKDTSKADLLTALARRLSKDLIGTAGAGTNGAGGAAGVMVPSFREREVRSFVDHRMHDDEELVRAVDDQDLFDSITAIMTRPDVGSMS
jgi:hypothetical protein